MVRPFFPHASRLSTSFTGHPKLQPGAPVFIRLSISLKRVELCSYELMHTFISLNFDHHGLALTITVDVRYFFLYLNTYYPKYSATECAYPD